MKRSLLLLLFLLIRQTIFAQFAGQVSDADNQPIAYANVCLLSGDSILISGTMTDENGRFVVHSKIIFISNSYKRIKGGEVWERDGF